MINDISVDIQKKNDLKDRLSYLISRNENIEFD